MRPTTALSIFVRGSSGRGVESLAGDSLLEERRSPSVRSELVHRGSPFVQRGSRARADADAGFRTDASVMVCR